MKDKGNKIKKIIIEHIQNNKKEYVIVLLLFVIGIFLGVLFVNYVDDTQKTQIESVLTNFIKKMQSIEKLDSFTLLKDSIMQKLLLAITIWFFGTTVIRYTNSIWNCHI